jgi:hypothetical protein
MEDEGIYTLMSNLPRKVEMLWICTYHINNTDKNGITSAGLIQLLNINPTNFQNIKFLELSTNEII